MPSLALPALIALVTAAPFILAYWIGRAVSRRRQGRWLQAPRAWRCPELAAVEREWLAEDWDPARLPETLSLVEVAVEWAAADPAVIADWRFARGSARGQGGEEDPSTNPPTRQLAPLTQPVRALWEGLSPAARERSEGLLRGALAAQAGAWSGAEVGWTGHPYVVPAPLGRRREAELRFEVVTDLTSAPAPGPLRAGAAAAAAEGWMLPLLLALQRRAPVRRIHPLAVHGPGNPLLHEVGSRVGSDVGRRVGASLGSILGPVGSAVGQYVGGMLGGAGGRTLAGRAKMEGPVAELEAAEAALVRLGELGGSEAFSGAARAPEEAWLARGTAWQSSRERRKVRLTERFWPSREQALGEECLRVALAELRVYRATFPLFLQALAGAKPLVRGGVLLQNPWLAPALPEGPERVTQARAALNRAARALKEGETAGSGE
jgi:hypothetical protein